MGIYKPYPKAQRKVDIMGNSNNNFNEWRLKKYLDAFGQIFALNICFVVACIPVFTIGASMTALYAMCIRIQEGEEETVVHGFIECFKKNFKKATMSFLVMVLVGVIMFGELWFINYSSGFISWFYTIFLALQIGAAGLMFPFVFPLISRYDNTVANTFKNSFLLSIGFLPSWIKFCTAWVGPIALSYIYPLIFTQTWWMWLVFLFGLIAWGTSFTIRAVFRGNKKAAEEKLEKENEDEQ